MSAEPHLPILLPSLFLLGRPQDLIHPASVPACVKMVLPLITLTMPASWGCCGDALSWSLEGAYTGPLARRTCSISGAMIITQLYLGEQMMQGFLFIFL